MAHEQHDELISAYLDGEVTAQQQAQVEQLLATSAEARQLLDELRAIRASLQGLPSHRLEPDFAQQVLRRAEREAGKSDPAPVEITSRQMPLALENKPWRPSMLRSTRGITWSLVAVAAAVLILVATRQEEKENRQVARATNSQSMAKEKSSGMESANDMSRVRAAPPENNITSGNLAAPSPSSVERAGGIGGAAPAVAASQGGAGEVTQKEEAAAVAPSGEQPVLVVQVGMSGEPAAKRDFEQVLADNHIVVESDAGELRDKLLPKQSPANRADRNSQDIEQALTEALQRDVKSRGRQANGTMEGEEKSRLDQAASAAGWDVVYVEATPQQMNAVLNELGRTKSITSLGVSESPIIASFNLSQASRNPGALKDESGVLGRAQRVPAVRDWFTRNSETLPGWIMLQQQPASQANKPAASAQYFGRQSQDAVSSSSLAAVKSMRLQPTAPAAGPANAEVAASPESGQFTPVRQQAALFVLRSSGPAGPAKAAVEKAGAPAEKQ